MNNKIIETLFDINIIINSVINEEKKENIILENEQNEIYKLLNKIENNYNMNEYIINGVKEKVKDIFEKEINNDNDNDNYKINNISTYINTSNNSVSNNNSIISSINNSCQSNSNKKNIYCYEEDEKSLSLLSKELKLENKEINKIYISEINNSKIFHFLNFIEQKGNKIIKIKINKEQVIEKINDIINDNSNYEYNDLDIKKIYLRKNVCIKLYKTFSLLFKRYNIDDKDIKKFCRIIENKARIIDYGMGNLYKEYIINILKNLSI